MGLNGALVLQVVLLPLPMISIDTTRGVTGFAALLHEQPLGQIGQQNSMPVITQPYANYAICPPQVSPFLSELNLPPIFFLIGTIILLSTFSCGHSLHQGGI